MRPAAMLATAAIVGAIGGVIGGALAPRPRQPSAWTATIVLTPNGDDCNVRTFPNAVLAARNDRVQWNVVGNCRGIELDNVELQFMGTCTAKGTNPQPWTVFTDNSNPRGRRMRRTIASGDEQCLAYRVWHVDRALEDPELEIVY